MHRLRSVRVFAGALVVALGGWAHAAPPQQPAPLPDGRAVIDHFVDAIGGRAAWQKIKSERRRGTFELVAQNMSGPFELLTARPDKSLASIELPAFGHIETGHDGKVGWLIDPQSGPMVLAGRMLSEVAEDSWFDEPLHLSSHVKELTTVERLEYDHRMAYKLKVVFLSGLEQFEYYDVESWLQLGWEGSRDSPMGVLPTSAYFRDYKTFGAVREPTTLLTRTLGMDQKITIASCEYDVVQPAAFAIPAVIKALIK